jgi:hypothetical protein
MNGDIHIRLTPEARTRGANLSTERPRLEKIVRADKKIAIFIRAEYGGRITGVLPQEENASVIDTSPGVAPVYRLEYSSRGGH